MTTYYYYTGSTPDTVSSQGLVSYQFILLFETNVSTLQQLSVTGTVTTNAVTGTVTTDAVTLATSIPYVTNYESNTFLSVIQTPYFGLVSNPPNNGTILMTTSNYYLLFSQSGQDYVGVYDSAGNYLLTVNLQYESITSPYNYQATFVFGIAPAIPVNVVFYLNDSNLVVNVTGTIDNVTVNGLLPTQSLGNNDNVIASLTNSPYFTTYGVALEWSGSYYLFFQESGQDVITQYSINFQPVMSTPLNNESMTISCLLQGTRVQCENGGNVEEKDVKDVNVGDVLVSDEGKKQRVSAIKCNSYSLSSDLALPFKLAKDAIAPNVPNRDLYLTEHHLIKHNEKWVHPIELGATKQTREDMSGVMNNRAVLTYFHFQVDGIIERCDVSVNIVANGVAVETYY